MAGKVRAYRMVGGAALLSTLSGTLVLGPAAPTAALQPAQGVLAATAVSATGLRGQGFLREPTASAVVYVEYVPPPRPAAKPSPSTYVWTPPPGYAVINVPIYQQAMPLDCETGALRMGLATFGHYYSDATLFAQENPDLRTPVMGSNHTVLQWGDPYTNFVGNVWGSDTAPTGYGVYWPVILRIAQTHGLPHATGGEGYSPSTVYAALQAHHPVEVWVETYWERPRLGTWTAWDGRRIRYSLIEHAVILTGVEAGMVRVNDPLHGTQYWISKYTFETVWRDFNDMAVIFQ